MGSYGGYQVVRELRRSPVGFEAIARPEGSKARDVLLEVRLPDPIAAPGEETVGIDRFLEQVAVQRLIGAANWVKVVDSGRSESEGYSIKEFYPRSAGTLVDSREKITSAQLRSIAVGIVDGLIVLRDRCGGRVHGALNATRVLIDEKRGATKWGVLLDAPGELDAAALTSEESLREDRRAIARVLIELVEKRRMMRTPPSIGVSEAWKAFAPRQAEAWVGAVNSLLDPHTEASSLPLEKIRSIFEAIPVEHAGPKKTKLVVGAIAVVFMLAVGGVVVLKLSGGPSPTPAPVVIIEGLTVDDWVGAADFLDEVRTRAAEFEKEPDELGEWFKKLQGFFTKMDQENENSRQWNGPADNPAFWWSNVREEQVQRLQTDESVQAAASWTIIKAGELRSQLLAQAPGKDRYDQIAGFLKATPAGSPALQLIDSASGSWGYWTVAAEASNETEATEQSDESVDDQARSAEIQERWKEDESQLDEFLGYLKAVPTAKALAGQLSDIQNRLDALVKSGQAGEVVDPVLSQVGRLAAEVVAGSQGGNIEDLLSDMASKAQAVSARLGTIEGTVSSRYPRVSRTELVAILKSKLSADPSALTWESLKVWNDEVTTNEAIVLFDPASNPVRAWLPGGNDAQWADGLRSQASHLEELRPKDREDPEIDALKLKAEQAIREVQGLLTEAVALPQIQRSLPRLSEIARETREKLDGDEGARLALTNKINSLEVRKADVVAELQGTVPGLSSIAQERLTDARKSDLAKAQATPDERKVELRGIRDHDESRVKLVQQIDRTFSDIGIDTSAAVQAGFDTSALTRKFGEVRDRRLGEAIGVALQSFETQPGGVSPAVDDAIEQLRGVAGEINSRLTQAAQINDDLNDWQPPGEIPELGQLSQWRIVAGDASSVDSTELTNALGEAIRPLLKRRDEAQADGALNDPGALIAIASEPLSKPERRWAAYVALDKPEFKWPRSATQLQGEVTLATTLIDAVASSSRRDQLVQTIQEVSAARWHEALEAARSVDDYKAVYAAREQFSKWADTLTDLDRRTQLVVELADSVGEQDREPANETEAAALDAQVADDVRGWIVTARSAGVFAGDTAGWFAQFADPALLTSEGGTGGSFTGDKHGPPSRGIGRVLSQYDEDAGTLTYDVGGEQLRLVRVGEFGSGNADGSGTGKKIIWFLQDREVSLGLYSAVVNAVSSSGVVSKPWWPTAGAAAVTGPCVWSAVGNGLAPASSWVAEPTWAASVGQIDVILPALQGADGRKYDVAEDRRPSLSMPIQQLDWNAMSGFADAVGLQLPALEVWQSAAAQVAPQSTSESALTAGLAGNLRANVRDETWKDQYAHFEANVQSQTTTLGRQLWMVGWYGEKATDGTGTAGDYNSVIDGARDGYLFFSPVDHAASQAGAAGAWYDLFGNVAEIALEGTEPRVLGGSAMSPPGLVSAKPQPWGTGFSRQKARADIGFRLALGVPADEFKQSVAQRVLGLLKREDAPVSWNTPVE